MLSLDATTRTEYDNATTAGARAQAVLAALSGTVTVRVYNGSGTVMGAGTMAAPWATRSANALTIGEVTTFSVTTTGTPDAASWYLRFESGTRWLRGSFGPGGDFTWSLGTWTAGQTGIIGTATATVYTEPTTVDYIAAWTVAGSTLVFGWTIPAGVTQDLGTLTETGGTRTRELSQYAQTAGGTPQYLSVSGPGTVNATTGTLTIPPLVANSYSQVVSLSNAGSGTQSRTFGYTVQAASTSAWPTQDVAAFQTSFGKIPVIPGVTAYGANQYGGSGRHLASPQTYVLFVDRLSTETVGGSSAGSANGSLDTANRLGYGSLSWCLTRNVPRVIVPIVSGMIDYGSTGSTLDVVNPYMTFAGQCAPSPGLYWKNRGHTSAGSTTRHHVWWHAGAFNGTASWTSTGTLWQSTGTGLLWANCSAMWARDESFVLGQSNSTESTSYASLWQCLSAEALGDTSLSGVYPTTTGHGAFSDRYGAYCDMSRSVALFCAIRFPFSRSSINVTNTLAGQWYTDLITLMNSSTDQNVNLEANLWMYWPSPWVAGCRPIYLPGSGQGTDVWRSTSKIWAPTTATAGTNYANRMLHFADRSQASSETDIFWGGNASLGRQTARLASWTPGHVPYSLTSGGDKRLDFAVLLLSHVGPRPKDRLSTISRVANYALNRATLNGGSIGSPPQNYTDVAALMPVPAQTSIANPFASGAFNNRTLPQAAADRDTVLTSGNFADGTSKAGYTALEAFLYDVHLGVMP